MTMRMETELKVNLTNPNKELNVFMKGTFYKAQLATNCGIESLGSIRISCFNGKPKEGDLPPAYTFATNSIIALRASQLNNLTHLQELYDQIMNHFFNYLKTKCERSILIHDGPMTIRNNLPICKMLSDDNIYINTANFMCWLLYNRKNLGIQTQKLHNNPAHAGRSGTYTSCLLINILNNTYIHQELDMSAEEVCDTAWINYLKEHKILFTPDKLVWRN